MNGREQKMKPAEVWDNGESVLRAYWYLRHATRLGGRVRLWGKPSIRNGGTLIVGDRVRIISTISTTQIDVSSGGHLEIGEGTSINYGTSIGATESIRIGPRCLIGNYTILMDNDFHSVEPERRYERPQSKPIVLEENVWLGARVTVLQGVTIGAGSVVAAGSLVTHDIPPRMLAVGVPARPMQKL
jgi:maltose O-acetyltransferase